MLRFGKKPRLRRVLRRYLRKERLNLSRLSSCRLSKILLIWKRWFKTTIRRFKRLSPKVSSTSRKSRGKKWRKVRRSNL